MARGWESKSVESQQAGAAEANAPHKRPLSPEELSRQHEREGLLLSRKHIADQLANAQNPRHKQMLEAALADLDAKIAALK
jgi:hypothetical protein